jgi:ribosome-associated protein
VKHSDTDQQPSKTRRKKAMHELQALGNELVALSAHQLETMDLPAELYEAVRNAHTMTKHEARRRQLQFIGRLMRDIDPGPIREQLAVWHGQSQTLTQRLHEIERWRERLLEDESALTEFARRYGIGAALQPLRACLREARREQAAAADSAQPPGRHFRQLFRLLRDVIGATRVVAASGEEAQAK